MNDQKIERILLELRDPATVRKRSLILLDKAKQNELKHFSIDTKQMIPTASYIIEIIKKNYPDLDIPYHSRWRHFETGGINRIDELLQKLPDSSPEVLGKMLYELVIISVFLDAGAGSSWQYIEPQTGKKYARSEGLALASLNIYINGGFSADPSDPLRVDAAQLIAFNLNDLSTGFQILTDNPLEGAKGRVALINQLGKALFQYPEYFGNDGRLGDFFTYVQSKSQNGVIEAKSIFKAALDAFNSIWPVRTLFNNVSLGDVWKYPALKTEELGSEFIPFHKLTQWLSYSLIEPLEQCGIRVVGLEQLTGLPEYRNGGLLIDMGLLVLKNPNELHVPHQAGSELVVEWRALTVALLDELATLIRTQLNVSSESLPLAKILQGGTWEAGRCIAKDKRPLGTPPLEIISDGTVF